MRKPGSGRTLGFVRRLVFVVAIFSASTISAQQAPAPQTQSPAAQPPPSGQQSQPAAPQPPSSAPRSLPAAQTAAPASATTVRKTTHLVLVDVVVYDKHGKHVTNLTAADFTLHDRGRQQDIAIFSNEHAGESVVEKAPPPQLPPDVFTNRPEYYRVEGSPTVLLLDGLNTAVAEQQSSHDYMLQYLRTQLKEGQKTAIFALNNSLLLLQDFTTDPRFLIAALDKNVPKASWELSGPGVTVLSPLEAHDMPKKVIDNLNKLNQTKGAANIEARVHITLAALRSIARALGGIPGRQNLIWVSF